MLGGEGLELGDRGGDMVGEFVIVAAASTWSASSSPRPGRGERASSSVIVAAASTWSASSSPRPGRWLARTSSAEIAGVELVELACEVNNASAAIAALELIAGVDLVEVRELGAVAAVPIGAMGVELGARRRAGRGSDRRRRPRAPRARAGRGCRGSAPGQLGSRSALRRVELKLPGCRTCRQSSSPGRAGRELLRRAARVVARELATSAASAAGAQIGEAIGRRIGARIYTPPPERDDDRDGDSGPDRSKP